MMDLSGLVAGWVHDREIRIEPLSVRDRDILAGKINLPADAPLCMKKFRGEDQSARARRLALLAFELRAVHDLTYAEIGALMGGVGASAAMQRVHKGIRAALWPDKNHPLHRHALRIREAENEERQRRWDKQAPQRERKREAELATREQERRALHPEYAAWLQKMPLVPNVAEVGEWEYWDFHWCFEQEMTPQQAVDFAIKFMKLSPVDADRFAKLHERPVR